jgi:hypothetical protein
MAAGNDGFLQMIAQALRGGAGGAGGAALESQGSGYREYATMAMANGETPMPEPQWRQMQMGAQQPPQQSPLQQAPQGPMQGM